MGFGHECMAALIVGQTIGHRSFGVEHVGPAIEHVVPVGLGAGLEGRGSMMDCMIIGLECMGLECMVPTSWLNREFWH